MTIGAVDKIKPLGSFKVVDAGDVEEGADALFLRAAERGKLATVQDRANHTGSQPISSVAGLQPRVLPAGGYNFEVIPAGAGTGFMWGFRGAGDNSFFGLITTDGVLAPDSFRAPASSVSLSALTAGAQSRLVRVGFNLSELPAGTGYSWGLRGADDSFFGLIDANGYFSPEKMLIPAGAVANSSLTAGVSSRMAPVGITLGPLPPGTGYLWGLRGSDGSFLGLVTNAGAFSPDGFTLPDATVSKSKLATDVLAALVPSVTSFRVLPAGMGLGGAAVGSDGSVLYTVDGTGKFDMKVTFADAATTSVLADGAKQGAMEGVLYNVWATQADLSNRQIKAQRISDGQIISVTTSGDNFAPRLDRTGKRVIFTTTGAGERVAQLDRDSGRGLFYPIEPTSEVTGIGDSYTAPGGSAWTSYLTLLAADPRMAGRTITNRGFGGDEGRHIAFRLGSVQGFVSVAGGAIPSSGAVAVTLSAGIYVRASSLPVIIHAPSGDVPGNLTTNDGGATFSFTRSSSGSAVTVPDGTEIVCSYADAARSTVRIIGFGLNDENQKRTTDEKIAWLIGLLDDQRTVAKKTIVMGHWDARYFNPTSVANVAAFNIRAQAEAAKRGMCFLDVRSYVVANANAIMAANGITPTATDAADLAKGLIPQSLHATGDDTHVSTVVHQIWANQVADLLIAKGY
jgi:hypothetical protein